MHLQRFYKKTAAFVLRAVAKHSAELAQAVVSCGAVAPLVQCMEELDIGVKEAAAWALSCIARHSECKSTHRGIRGSPFISQFFPPPPPTRSVGSFGGGCRCRPSAAAVSQRARGDPQTHRGRHAQRHQQTHAGAGPGSGGPLCHHSSVPADPPQRHQTQSQFKVPSVHISDEMMNIRSKLCFAFLATSPIQCVTGRQMHHYIGITA